MHPIWKVDDVVYLILRQCTLGEGSALARTCKLLFQPGVAVLWEHPALRGLADLLQPQTHGSIVDSVRKLFGVEAGIQRRSSRVERFAFYTRHVQALSVRAMDSTFLEELLDFLSTTDRQLFPNLKRIEIEARTVDELTKSCEMTAHTPASHITVSLFTLGRALPNRSFPAQFFQYLDGLKTLQNLDELLLRGPSTQTGLEPNFLQSVYQVFPRLQRLTIDPSIGFGFELVPLCSLFRSLTSLELIVWNTSSSEIPTTSISFPSLETLILTYRNANSLNRLLSIFSAPEIRCIRLRCATLDVDPISLSSLSSSYHSLSNTIASSFLLLRELSLSGYIVSSPSAVSEPWTFASFAPLLACPHVVLFTVQTRLRVTTSDDELRSIARAWPGLRYLVLSIADGYLFTQPVASLQGLLQIASTCPWLENICLSVNLSSSPDSLLALDTIRPNPSVLRLDVHDCPPCDAEHAARVLRHVFPNLKRFRFATRRFERDSDADRADEERLRCMGQIRTLLGLK